MKQKILEALQAKFSGVDAKILERMADKVAKTVTKKEDITTAVEGVTFQQVIDSQADFRATQASETAGKNAVAAYEKLHGLKDGEKANLDGGAPATKPNPQSKPVESEAEPEWAKKLREQNERIERKMQEDENAKAQGGFTTKLVNVLKEKGVRKSFYTPIINGRTFKDEDEVSAFADTVAQSFADDEQSVANSKHQTSHKPDSSQGGGDGDDPLLKAAQEKTDKLAEKK